jgi:hypothetical protein
MERGSIIQSKNNTEPHFKFFHEEEWFVIGFITGIIWVLIIYYMYRCGKKVRRGGKGGGKGGDYQEIE